MESKNSRGPFGHRNEAKEKTITDEQFERFIKAVAFVEEPEYIAFWENIYYCASYLGLRSIETCKVRIEDIDFLAKTLTLPEQKNKVRFEKIIIPDFMLERLKEHIIKYKAQIIINSEYGSLIHDPRIISKAKKQEIKGEYYLFWRMKQKIRGCKRYNEKHMDTSTIRTHLIKTRKTAGLDMKYGMTNTGHALSILSYHTLRHYYLQKICDQRGVFAAQISGRHKNLRSTERYLTTSLTAKQSIVNEVFNVKEETATYEISQLKDEIAELKTLIKESMIISNGNPRNIKNQNRIAIEESENYMQNRALYQARKIRRVTEETEVRKEVIVGEQF
ncbi:tyrosine-type recombinase/integrase [Candidatus Woesearchaeota archaeon]|nr:tyrosine-type recombinase/integrase [Candidatus Woesearchaeota archaeon]